MVRSRNETFHSHYELEEKKWTSRPVATLILINCFLALLISIGLSISFGAVEIDLMTVWTAVFQFNPDVTSHQIIKELRMPRAVAAAFVGAFLAVSVR